MLSKENNHVATFTKENLDGYLKAVAKEYSKRGGRTMPAEVILIGGAAVLAGYGFREMTTDIDALIHSASTMKEAINYVGDMNGLPYGWLNTEFMKTDSFSSKIRKYSVPYKKFYYVMNVRIVTGEYLIAMKLMAGRRYKSDLSDIIGILAEHEKSNSPISLETIKKAVVDLYDDWEKIPSNSKDFLEDVLNRGHYSEMYEKIRSKEIIMRSSLIQFESDYPDVVTPANVNDILDAIEKRKFKSQENK